MLTSSRAGRRASTAVLAAVVLLLGLAGRASAAPPPPPGIRGAGSTSAIPGSYLVKLRDSAAARAGGIAARARSLVDGHKGTLGYLYDSAVHGFSAAMSEQEAVRLAADPDVEYVEQDQLLQLADTQDSPPAWGLDRVDQRALPLDSSYSFDPPATTVTAYVIDTGIRKTHTDFGGRASWGWNFHDDNAIADDCYTDAAGNPVGHGTHVAGTVGGTTYGVAKRVNLVAVKVFGCSGGAATRDVLAAVNWVTAHAVKPAAVNMSIALRCTPCDQDDLDMVSTAITISINSGLPYSIAAGNDNDNACNGLYARVPQAITVGATDINDARASYSNWGPCINIFAPGGDQPAPVPTPGILSLNRNSDTATLTMSGTSMAAPHVAGAIALILGRPGWAAKTPGEITDELVNHMATNGMVTDPVAGHGSTTRLLHTAPPPKAGGSSIAVGRYQGGRLALYGVNASGALFYRSQDAGGINTWSGWTQSDKPGWYSVAAQTDGHGHVELIGLQRASQAIWHRTQAFVDADSWSNWHQFDGLLNSVAVAKTGPGKLEVFGTNALGQGWHRSQNTVGANDYTVWEPFNLPGGTLRSVAADTNADGLVEAFALTTAGQIWHRWQTAAAATTYTPWVQLDGARSSIAVGRNKDGTLQLFAVDSAGQIWRRAAAPGTNNWFSWSQLDSTAAVGVLHSLAAETNSDGRVELFGVNTAGQLWHRWQTTAGSDTYSPWTELDGLLRP